MMKSAPNQLNLLLDNKNEISIEELAASANSKLREIIDDTKTWPSNSLCVFAQAGDGTNFIANHWSKAGNHREVFFISNGANIDENLLLEKMVNAEQLQIYLLIISTIENAKWEIKSADLLSRLSNLTCVNSHTPTRVTLAKIFQQWCKHYGILVQKKDIEYIFNALPPHFVTISQLICIIKNKYSQMPRIDRAQIVQIIGEFEAELNPELFENVEIRDSDQPNQPDHS